MFSPAPHEHRLDRILELVTEHERVYREQAGACYTQQSQQRMHPVQYCPAAVVDCLGVNKDLACAWCPPFATTWQDIRLADLVQKVTELDVRCTAETAPLGPLKVGGMPVVASAAPCSCHDPFDRQKGVIPVTWAQQQKQQEHDAGNAACMTLCVMPAAWPAGAQCCNGAGPGEGSHGDGGAAARCCRQSQPGQPQLSQTGTIQALGGRVASSTCRTAHSHTACQHC